MSGLCITNGLRACALVSCIALGCAGRTTESKGSGAGDAGPMSGGAASTGGTMGSGGVTAGSGGSGGNGGATAPGALLGTFQLTYYWVTAEADFTGTNDTNLYDSACNVLATVTSAFAATIKLEGTGRLADGRLLNLSGSCAASCSSQCFAVLGPQFPWGEGAQSNALVPFRSIAVDRSVIPLGTSIYVEELDGVTMPGDATYGQFVHDGCVRADDIGGGIVGQHIDFFAALESNYVALDAVVPGQVSLHLGGTRCP
jgi:3D (Asp-Asp-Asp) domain-containing protein